MNRLVIGSTGIGKSYGQLHRLGEAQVYVDPHTDSLARKGVEHSRNRLIVFDCLDDTERVLAFELLEITGNPIIDDMRIHAFVEMLIRRRGLTNLRERPLTEEWLIASLQAWASLSKKIPLYALAEVFEAGSPVFRHMVAYCQDDNLRRKLTSIAKMGPVAVRRECGAAMRIFEAAFRSPSFRARCHGDFDPVGFLNMGGSIFIEGGRASEDAKHITLGAWCQKIIQSARQGLLTRRAELIIDEASTIIGGFEANALAELQKDAFGLDVTLISQSVPEEFKETILQNCDRLEVFRCNSQATAKMAAEMLGTITLDVNAIARTERRGRQIHDGYETIHTKTGGRKFDRDGKVIGTDERGGIVSRAKYAEVIEEIHQYKSYGDQIKEMEQAILTLKIGERFVREGGRVWREQVKPLQDLYPWGLSKIKAEQRIADSISRYGKKLSASSQMTTPSQSNRALDIFTNLESQPSTPTSTKPLRVLRQEDN